MFGDDPDPTVTTVRVGSETASDTREGSMHCAERVRLGLGGLWRAGWSERRGERNSPTRFPETKNVRRYTGYTAALVNGWAIKQTPNVMRLDRRSIYTIIRPHANFYPIPRTFSGHL